MLENDRMQAVAQTLASDRTPEIARTLENDRMQAIAQTLENDRTLEIDRMLESVRPRMS